MPVETTLPEGVHGVVPFPTLDEYQADPGAWCIRSIALKIPPVLDSLMYDGGIQTELRRQRAADKLALIRHELSPFKITPHEYESIIPERFIDSFEAARFAASLMMRVSTAPVPHLKTLDREMEKGEITALALRDVSLMSLPRLRMRRTFSALNQVIGFVYEMLAEPDPRPDRTGKTVLTVGRKQT